MFVQSITVRRWCSILVIPQPSTVSSNNINLFHKRCYLSGCWTLAEESLLFVTLHYFKEPLSLDFHEIRAKGVKLLQSGMGLSWQMFTTVWELHQKWLIFSVKENNQVLPACIQTVSPQSYWLLVSSTVGHSQPSLLHCMSAESSEDS